MSSSKRQAAQRKPFALSSVSAQTSSRLRIHGTSVPAAPHLRPRLRPTYCPSCTLPPQSRMQFPNRSDSIIRSDTNQQHAQGELHAKLPGSTRVRPPGGHRGACEAWPRCRWSAAGPGRANRSHKPRPIGGHREACGDRPRCRWAAAGPGQAHAHQAPPDWRPPRGLRGLAGLRDDAPSEARSADGERAGRPRGGRRSGGAEQHRRSGGQPQQAAPQPAAAQ